MSVMQPLVTIALREPVFLQVCHVLSAIIALAEQKRGFHVKQLSAGTAQKAAHCQLVFSVRRDSFALEEWRVLPIAWLQLEISVLRALLVPVAALEYSARRAHTA